MSAFEVQGKTVTFTGATSAPTAVQCLGNSEVRTPQYILTNTGNVDVFVSYATDVTNAASGAVIPTATSRFGFWLLSRTQVSLTAPPDAFFTGITASGTAVVYVTPGYGE